MSFPTHTSKGRPFDNQLRMNTWYRLPKAGGPRGWLQNQPEFFKNVRLRYVGDGKYEVQTRISGSKILLDWRPVPLALRNPSEGENSYLSFQCRYKGKNIQINAHKAIGWLLFNFTEDMPQINHIDGKRQNNEPSNLEPSNAQHNMEAKALSGMSRAIYPPTIMAAIREAIKTEPNNKVIAARYDVPCRVVANARMGWTRRLDPIAHQKYLQGNRLAGQKIRDRKKQEKLDAQIGA